MSRYADDSAAMKALQGGDDRALDDLMARWKGKIVAYLYRMLGNYHDAVELAQETFVKVYFECHRFDTKRSFSAWLYTIASNLGKNKLRWWSRHTHAPFEEHAHHAPELDKGDEVLMKCVSDLAPELREVILLFEVEEKTHEEIAQIIGKSAKTVGARLYKAREKLKKAYDSHALV